MVFRSVCICEVVELDVSVAARAILGYSWVGTF